ncbi:MAG: hypothetical protein CML31_17780 [Rhizobiales bacterium]|nr:hypothetical protein [Hyphomicrobiales bacterium]
MSRHPGAKGRRDRLRRFSNPRLWVEIFLCRGGAPRPKPRDIPVPKQAFPDELNVGQINARPVLALLDGLPSEEVSRLAVDIIRENRRRVDLAQSLFEKLEESEAADSSNHALENLRREYRIAMLELKIHHELVRLIVDVLGYVPELDEVITVQ